jgi:hypothetical protein
MRYRFVDAVVSCRTEDPARIEVAKTFPRGDDAFTGPRGPDEVPASLLLELMATTGGRLVLRRLEGSRLPLLLKVRECGFEAPAPAGAELRATAELDGLADASARASVAEVRGEVRAGGARLAWARLLFVCVSLPGVDLARAEASA